jgi:DNA helicase-2/ATP-dependent DNA helicase PcrA
MERLTASIVEIIKYPKSVKFNGIYLTIKNNQNFQDFISEYLNEVIIDEAQDLDKLQYEILFLLNQYIKNLRLFFVGDQRQNIYAFKGGSLNNILDLANNMQGQN